MEFPLGSPRPTTAHTPSTPPGSHAPARAGLPGRGGRRGAVSTFDSPRPSRARTPTTPPGLLSKEAPRNSPRGHRLFLAPLVGPRPPMVRALEDNNLGLLRQCLDEDAMLAVECLSDGRRPPLVVALLEKCSPALVQLLLERGADPEVGDRHHLMPMDILVGPEKPEAQGPLEALQAASSSSALALMRAPPPPPAPLPAPPTLEEWTAENEQDLPPMLLILQRLRADEQRREESETQDEALACAYASLLLRHGFGKGSANKARQQKAAWRAKANGRERLACLIEHAAAEQLVSLRHLRARANLERPIEGTPSHLLILKKPLFSLVCDMLMPRVP